MKRIYEYLGILVGCFFVALGFVLFINPYKLVPGGVFGTCIVLHNLFPSIQVGTFGYILEVPILLLSVLCLGKGLGARTLIASFASPFFMNLITDLCYSSEEAIQSLDPGMLLGGSIDLSNNLILAAIIGPLLYGLGGAIIVRCKASSGGSDVVAMILSKYTHIKFSSALLLVDATIVIMGILVIGLHPSNHEENHQAIFVLSGYSLICIYVASRTIAYVISGAKNNKLMFIVAEKETERLRKFILKDIDRTATVVQSKGLYSQAEKLMLMICVNRREVDYITSHIEEIDPSVFIVITDAYDTFGQRWSELPDINDLNWQ